MRACYFGDKSFSTVLTTSGIFYSATSATVAAVLWPFASLQEALCSASASRATEAAASGPWAAYPGARVAVVTLGQFFRREMAVASSCHPAHLALAKMAPPAFQLLRLSFAAVSRVTQVGNLVGYLTIDH